MPIPHSCGRVDVGVVCNPGASPAVGAKPLLEEQLGLIAINGKGRAPRTLRLADSPQFPRLAELGPRPSVVMEIDAVPAILELVAEGHGNAVLSPGALSGAEAAHVLCARAIVKPQLTSRLVLATSAQRPSTPIQQRTIELIERLIGPGLATR